MKTPIQSSLLFLLTLCFAQPTLAYPHARTFDSPQDDPSPKPGLTLREEVPQKDLFLFPNLFANFFTPTSVPDLYSNHGVSYQNLLSIKRTHPENNPFAILSLHRSRYTPSVENAPSFVNQDWEYKGIGDKKYGYCWGMSTLVRYFQTLAFFDPRAQKLTLKEYKKRVESIAHGNPAVIPGYANFRELSLVPEIELYMKVLTMDLWRSRTVRAPSLAILRHSSDRMTRSQLERKTTEIETRLANGEFPKIIFSSLIPEDVILGMNTNIHVVLAYKVERNINQTTRIYLWDIDNYGESLNRTPQFFEISSTGKIVYAPWLDDGETPGHGQDQIAKFDLTPENDDETVQMVQNLKSFCAKSANQVFCK